MIWHCREYSFDTKMPIIMGILNITPDSFSDGGQYNNLDAAIEHAETMVAQGAAIVDIGGESTRPGAEEIAPDEEWQRVGDVIRELVSRNICVSIDTRHAEVARRAIEAGASIINDVSGFRDDAMVDVARACDAGLVVVHMAGNPQTMQDNPVYNDVVSEVRNFLQMRCRELEAAGIAHDRICIDPGPGFGKTVEQTVELMRNLHEFVRLGYPVMAAPSRKSYVGSVYHIDDPQQRDAASATEALYACELGASVIRTHNVEETLHALADLRPYVLLGLGSNTALDNGQANAEPDQGNETKISLINAAISQLCLLPDSQIIDIAGFYGSKPAYFEEQDDFVNTVVLLRCGLAPRELLKYIHIIENSLRRVREIENGPRTIDIDILDYQLYNFSTEDLSLPHPRVTERDFVVKPLLEILPHHVLANGVAVDSVPEEKRVGKAWKLNTVSSAENRHES